MLDRPERLHRQFERADPAPLEKGRENDGYPDLRVIEGGHTPGNESPPPSELVQVLDVDVKERFGFGRGHYRDREGRIERLRLSNGNVLTATVYPADEQAIKDGKTTGLTLSARGYTEMPSVENSSASNLDREGAMRLPGSDWVSFDRHGYSQYDPVDWPWKTFKKGLETEKSEAADLLAAARYYSQSKNGNLPVRLFGVSAGCKTTVVMAVQNESLPEEMQIEIEGEVKGVVPCLKMKKIPSEKGKPPKSENEKLIRALTLLRFGGHAGTNTLEAGVQKPFQLLRCAGIVGVLGIRVDLWPAIPAHIIRHTSGTEHDFLVRATRRNTYRFVEADDDILKTGKLFEKVNDYNSGAIAYPSIPGGHVSVPTVHYQRALDELRIYDEDLPPSGIHDTESSIKESATTILKVGRLTARQVVALGKVAPSVLRGLAAKV